MRGAMVGLTDEELLDIAEEVHQAGPKASHRPVRHHDAPLVSHGVARSVLTLQKLRARKRHNAAHTLGRGNRAAPVACRAVSAERQQSRCASDCGARAAL